MTQLRKTALSAWHEAHGGRMVPFAGWSMPVQYEGVMAEHRAVREAAGLFDVSHMAELAVRGPQAVEAVDRLVTNNVARLEDGQVLYTAMCRADGGILDDLLVYRHSAEHLLIVGNAANHERDRDWIAGHLEGEVEFTDESDRTALIALQGPRSRDILSRLPELAAHRDAVGQLGYYRFFPTELGGAPAVVSRTGYTGELGFEIYLAPAAATAVWEGLMAAGEGDGLVPVGLGARDTLRLEAGFSLYGHELDEETTPYEAGIGWTVRLKAGDFLGRDVLAEQKEAGPPRTTIALLPEGRASARQGAPVLAGDEVVGEVSSGSFSPTLGRPIAIARVRSDAVENELAVELRGRRVAAARTELPFVPNRTRG